jgi:hypothetical protein
LCVEAVEQAGLLHDRREGLGLGEVEGGRLVAQHVEAALERGLGGGEVDVVRRDDGHEVDALVGRQRRLASAPVRR